MIVEIVTIGTEILIGSILNSNANYLSRQVVGLGLETQYHTSVDDNKTRLKDIINIARNRADIIITTGGLGPTDDDLSKEVVADALGLEMVKDIEAENTLINRFRYMKADMTKNNLRQTFKPKGSTLIPNDRGTAPGIYIEHYDSKIIMLPGPPREMTYMFENYVVDLIKGKHNIVTRSLNTFGIGESTLEEELKSLNIFDNDLEIATFAHLGTCEIKIIARGSNLEDLNRKINDKVKIIEKKLGNYIYGYDNTSLEEIVIQNLKKNNYTISTCESCTGGLLASKITSIPGASEVFGLGLITYSNQSKNQELNVSNITLSEFGAVSEETAYEMAKGLYDKTKANVIISITGLAGPDGGSRRKPVGQVYFCIMIDGVDKLISAIFPGDRLSIQERAANFALSELNKLIK